jgi:UDP-hydrolysing UDP-N-acetyl-D-glucosamine 2-epimerase
MFAAASAAALLNIPLAHLHGGESTEGAVDEVFRHALTKMSHLHFVSHLRYADRVVQMGEEPWRVTVSGAPALDAIGTMRFMSKQAIRRFLKVSWDRRPLLVTFHPTTLEPGQSEVQMKGLVKALEDVSDPIVWTYPNADAEGGRIITLLEKFGATHPSRVRVIKNLGPRAYFSLMRHSRAMVGNSSSGIIEAASFQLPVINVGRRQQGRWHGNNVIDVGHSTDDIRAGLRKIVSRDFQRSLRGIENPYGDGRAADRIVKVLKNVDLCPALMVKRFWSQEGGESR